MKRDYTRLDVVTFGKHLIKSKDLDPLYVVAQTTDWDRAQKYRWLVAYWCLYHAGAAAYISEAQGTEFWHRLRTAAENTEPAPTGGRWPRGHERRHWRAANALKSWAHLQSRYPNPERMVDDGMLQPHNLAGIMDWGKSHVGFGPWISFKIADMLDACTYISVRFDETNIFMFDAPQEGAREVWRATGEPLGVNQTAIDFALDYLNEHLHGLHVPHDPHRTLGLQEYETILCKWKSHLNGHYQLNNDLIEIRDGLSQWAGTCETANKMLNVLPKPL